MHPERAALGPVACWEEPAAIVLKSGFMGGGDGCGVRADSSEERNSGSQGGLPGSRVSRWVKM